MKRIIYILATAFICSIAVYFFISQNNIENKPGKIRIIANFNKGVISGNTLTTQVTGIKDENIRELFARFDVVELQDAYRNSYDKDGYLKPGIKSSTPGT